jgi:hypothetical protein
VRAVRRAPRPRVGPPRRPRPRAPPDVPLPEAGCIPRPRAFRGRPRPTMRQSPRHATRRRTTRAVPAGRPPFGPTVRPRPPARVRHTTAGNHIVVTSGRASPYLNAATLPSARHPSRSPPLPLPPGARASASSHRRPTVPLSSLESIAPPRVTHCPAKRPPHRNPEPPRPPLPATAEHPRRRLPRPNRGYQSTLGEHALDPEPFPSREHRRSHRISGEPAIPWVEGPNCVVLNLSRGLVAKIHL